MAEIDRVQLVISHLDKQSYYSLDHLEQVSAQYSSLFNRFYVELSQLNQLSGSEELIVKIKTFALHCFCRSSTLPIVSSHDCIDRSPLDYLASEDNTPSYYRGDGSSIFRIFFDVFRELFAEIKLDNKYFAGLIKPSRFMSAMQIACAENHFQYLRIESPSLITYDVDKCFFDLSSWIKGRLPQGWSSSQDEWDSLLAEIQEFATDIQDKTILLGGVIEFNSFVGMYIFFTSEQLINLDEEDAPFYELISAMLNYRGNTGSYPEMIMVKRALAQSAVTIVSPTNATETATADDLSKVELLVDEKDPFYPYAILLKLLINEVKTLENTSTILQSKRKIAMCIQRLNQVPPFQAALNDYQFIMEQIIFLSLFMNFDKDLEEVIRESHPISDKGTILCFNSGMATFDYIIEALRTEYPQDGKPNLAILEGCYYELKDELRWPLHNLWNTSIQKPNPNFEKAPDLLFLDLFPNNVKCEVARENPVSEIILEALNKRDQSAPSLVAVLDTSTHLLTHPKIKKIIDELHPLIEQGTLRLLLVSSLAKFYSCGHDKYTGGVMIYYGQDKQLPLKLKQYRDKDPMSSEAKSFYSLMTGKALQGIESFYHQSLQNTGKLYNELQHLNKSENDSLELVLQEKDVSIPVIGLHSTSSQDTDKRDSVKEAQENFSENALADGRPLFIRASFPFAHSTVIECDTALRWIAGLDTPENLKYYSRLIKDYNDRRQKTKD